MISLGCIPTFKAPYEKMLQITSRSKTYIRLRGLLTRRFGSRVETFNPSTKRLRYTRQDDKFIPLEHRQGETTNDAFALPEGAWAANGSQEPIIRDAEDGATGIKLTRLI